MRALVVGADGFAGRWLVRHLAKSGDAIDGIVGARFEPPLDGVENVLPVDVRDERAVLGAVLESGPDAIYYLAAVSEVEGRDRLGDAAGVALVGAINVLHGAAGLQPAPKLIYVSSSHVYGRGGDAPMDEEAPILPLAVYGAAKAAAEQALFLLGAAAGIQVVVARPFNHIGPGQRESFLVPSLIARIRKIMTGKGEDLPVGSPNSVRDFTDVRDVVAAYRLLADHGESGEAYNVASGIGYSVRQIAQMLLNLVGSSAGIVEYDMPERVQELATIIGNPGKLERLGWRRRWTVEESLSDLVEPGSIGLR